MNWPIEAAITQPQPDDDSGNEKPLCKIAKSKEHVKWKWMKKFTEEPLK